MKMAVLSATINSISPRPIPGQAHGFKELDRRRPAPIQRAIAEVDTQDRHQVLTIGIAVVFMAGHAGHAGKSDPVTGRPRRRRAGLSGGDRDRTVHAPPGSRACSIDFLHTFLP